jgi:hypothetical protein
MEQQSGEESPEAETAGTAPGRHGSGLGGAMEAGPEAGSGPGDPEDLQRGPETGIGEDGPRGPQDSSIGGLDEAGG